MTTLVEKAKQYRETFIEVVFNGVRYKPDDEAVTQLRDKYLKTERVAEGYVIVFDPDTHAGELCIPKRIEISKSGQIISFNIGIGKISGCEAG